MTQGRGRDVRRSAAGAALAGGLVAGVALDAVFGDPQRHHPVAGFGRFASALERRVYADSRAAGVGFVALAVGVPTALGMAAEMTVRSRPLLRAVAVAATTWAVLGGRSLRREATAMADALGCGDLEAARARLPHLCGRDPSGLEEKGLTRATVESVAENTSDAVVAPLVWGAIGGIPGLVAYRSINTLDAMVGMRSPRYVRFGMVSARLDDVANIIPSRLTGALMVALAGRVGGSARRAARIALRDGGKHPSPNSGQCEAAAAGALDVRLGGTNRYLGRVDHRPHLGDGPPPVVSDIGRMVCLSSLVSAAAAGIVAGTALIGRARRVTARGLSPRTAGNRRREVR